MGFGGIGFGELLLIFAIVVVLFGTQKLKSLGSDLGTAIRGFRQAMNDGAQDEAKANPNLGHSPQTQQDNKIENRTPPTGSNFS